MPLPTLKPTADTGLDASYTGQSTPATRTSPPDMSAFQGSLPQRATPLSTPSSFTSSQDTSNLSLTLSPPPDYYMPKGPQYEPSFLEKLAGGVPQNLQIKGHILDLQKKQMEIQQGWQNAQIHAQVSKQAYRRHEADMENNALSQLPNARAHVGSMQLGTPERILMENHYSEMFHRQSSSVGHIWDTYTKNPSAHFAANYAISQSPELQQLYDNLKEGVYENPKYIEDANVLGRDVLEGVMGNFTTAQQEKIASGKMTQQEFKDAYRNAAVGRTGAKPIPADRMQWGLEHMMSADGERWLAGKKIQTDKMAEERAKKRSQMPAKDVRIEDELADIDEQLAHPEKLTNVQYQELKHKREIYLDTRVKDGIMDNKTLTPADHYLIAHPNNQGRYQNVAQLHQAIANGTATPNDRSMLEESLAAKAAANPFATANVARQQPVNAADKYIFSRESIVKGAPKRFFGEMTDAQLKTGKDYVELKPDQFKVLTTLETTRAAANELLGSAEKLFQHEGFTGSLQQFSQSIATQVPGFQALVPELTAYNKGLEAMSTQYARSIGMEVGVLTDTDVKRWMALLPSGSDTKEISRIKIAKFKRVLDYVSGVNSKMIAGDIPIGSETEPYRDKKHLDTVQGLLGDAEASIKKVSPKTHSSSSEDKPKKSAAQRLSDMMHAQSRQEADKELKDRKK